MEEHAGELCDYTLVSELGSGSSGVVILGKHKLTKAKVAIKVVHRQEDDGFADKNLKREIAFLSLLNHPNIIRLDEVRTREQTVYLIMEYFEGDELFSTISRRALSERRFRPLFRQMVDALAYAHNRNISHRDLKPENILVDQTLSAIKIIDFGYSTSFDEQTSSMETICGSPHYISPEILKGATYGPKVDVWSLGCILYASLLNCYPFSGESLDEIFNEILVKRPKLPESRLTEDCIDLLNGMLEKEPEDRLSMDEVRLHPWLSQGYSGPTRNHERASMNDVLESDVVDETVIDEMADMGFSVVEVMESLRARVFDNHVNVYHLILEKRAHEAKRAIRRQSAPSTLLLSTTTTTDDALPSEEFALPPPPATMWAEDSLLAPRAPGHRSAGPAGRVRLWLSTRRRRRDDITSATTLDQLMAQRRNEGADVDEDDDCANGAVTASQSAPVSRNVSPVSKRRHTVVIVEPVNGLLKTTKRSNPLARLRLSTRKSKVSRSTTELPAASTMTSPTAEPRRVEAASAPTSRSGSPVLGRSTAKRTRFQLSKNKSHARTPRTDDSFLSPNSSECSSAPPSRSVSPVPRSARLVREPVTKERHRNPFRKLLSALQQRQRRPSQPSAAASANAKPVVTLL